MSTNRTESRADRFRQDVADLRPRDPVTTREQVLAVVGVLAMVGGVVLGLVAVSGSHATTNPLTQRDYVIVALVGLTIAVAGAALFLRYSLAQFLRRSLARVLLEQRLQTDRLVQTMGGGDRQDEAA